MSGDENDDIPLRDLKPEFIEVLKSLEDTLGFKIMLKGDSGTVPPDVKPIDMSRGDLCAKLNGLNNGETVSFIAKYDGFGVRLVPNPKPYDPDFDIPLEHSCGESGSTVFKCIARYSGNDFGVFGDSHFFSRAKELGIVCIGEMVARYEGKELGYHAVRPVLKSIYKVPLGAENAKGQVRTRENAPYIKIVLFGLHSICGVPARRIGVEQRMAILNALVLKDSGVFEVPESLVFSASKDPSGKTSFMQKGGQEGTSYTAEELVQMIDKRAVDECLEGFICNLPDHGIPKIVRVNMPDGSVVQRNEKVVKMKQFPKLDCAILKIKRETRVYLLDGKSGNYICCAVPDVFQWPANVRARLKDIRGLEIDDIESDDEDAQHDLWEVEPGICHKRYPISSEDFSKILRTHPDAVLHVSLLVSGVGLSPTFRLSGIKLSSIVVREMRPGYPMRISDICDVCMKDTHWKSTIGNYPRALKHLDEFSEGKKKRARNSSASSPVKSSRGTNAAPSASSEGGSGGSRHLRSVFPHEEWVFDGIDACEGMNLFQGEKFYIREGRMDHVACSRLKNSLEKMGATIQKNNGTTVCISFAVRGLDNLCSTAYETMLKKMLGETSNRHKTAYIVEPTWVEACIRERKRIPMDRYVIQKKSIGPSDSSGQAGGGAGFSFVAPPPPRASDSASARVPAPSRPPVAMSRPAPAVPAQVQSGRSQSRYGPGMHRLVPPNPSMNDLESEFRKLDGNPIFRGCCFLCKCTDDDEQEIMEMARKCIEARGGVCFSNPRDGEYNIMLLSCEIDGFGATMDMLNRYKKTFAVTFLWIFECIRQNKLLPFKGYDMRGCFLLGIRVYVRPCGNETSEDTASVYLKAGGADIRTDPSPDVDYILVAEGTPSPASLFSDLKKCSPGTFVVTRDWLDECRRSREVAPVNKYRLPVYESGKAITTGMDKWAEIHDTYPEVDPWMQATCRAGDLWKEKETQRQKRLAELAVPPPVPVRPALPSADSGGDTTDDDSDDGAGNQDSDGDGAPGDGGAAKPIDNPLDEDFVGYFDANDDKSIFWRFVEEVQELLPFCKTFHCLRDNPSEDKEMDTKEAEFSEAAGLLIESGTANATLRMFRDAQAQFAEVGPTIKQRKAEYESNGHDAYIEKLLGVSDKESLRKDYFETCRTLFSAQPVDDDDDFARDCREYESEQKMWRIINCLHKHKMMVPAKDLDAAVATLDRIKPLLQEDSGAPSDDQAGVGSPQASQQGSQAGIPDVMVFKGSQSPASSPQQRRSPSSRSRRSSIRASPPLRGSGWVVEKSQDGSEVVCIADSPNQDNTDVQSPSTANPASVAPPSPPADNGSRDEPSLPLVRLVRSNAVCKPTAESLRSWLMCIVVALYTLFLYWRVKETEGGNTALNDRMMNRKNIKNKRRDLFNTLFVGFNIYDHKGLVNKMKELINWDSVFEVDQQTGRYSIPPGTCNMLPGDFDRLFAVLRRPQVPEADLPDRIGGIVEDFLDEDTFNETVVQDEGTGFARLERELQDFLGIKLD